MVNNNVRVPCILVSDNGTRCLDVLAFEGRLEFHCGADEAVPTAVLGHSSHFQRSYCRGMYEYISPRESKTRELVRVLLV